jgi:uncharacterized membrane protein YphA (DoxX/SURF4 family)
MRNIVTWILSVLLALAFFGFGLAKLTAQPMMVQSFESFGYPLWFMSVTGVLEIVGAVLVLVPRFAFVGAGLLVCIMVGALFAHLTHGQVEKIVAPLVLLVLAAVVGTLRGWGRGAVISRLSRAT